MCPALTGVGGGVSVGALVEKIKSETWFHNSHQQSPVTSGKDAVFGKGCE